MARRAGGWLIAGGLAAIGAAMQPAPAQADPFAGIPNLTFQYYQIRGADLDEIDTAIREHGPIAQDGWRGIGRTDNQIGFSWGEMERRSSCRVTDVTMRYSATIHLPRLVDEARLAPPVRAEWRRLLAEVRAHEAEHARIAYDRVDEVRRAVASAPCGKVGARGNAVIERIDRLQKEFDRRTAHGTARGAVAR